MRRGTKYFVLGFFFYLSVSILSFWLWDSYSYSTYMAFTGFIAAVVVAVGLIKGPRAGFAFGLSSFVPDTFSGILISARYRYYSSDYINVLIMNSIFLTIVQIGYGCLASVLYWRRRKMIVGLAGFVVALIIDLFISGFIIRYTSFGQIFWNFAFGGVSTLASIRYVSSRPSLLVQARERPSPTEELKSSKLIERASKSPSRIHRKEVTLLLPDDSELPIGKARTIGREDLAKFVSKDQTYWIAKQHFTIMQENGIFFIKDEGTTTGTKLNGAELDSHEKKELDDGAEIIVADIVKLTFMVDANKKSRPWDSYQN